MINPWTPDALDEWSQWWRLAMTPAVAWRRAWQAAYRPRPPHGPAIITPLRPPVRPPRVTVTELVEPAVDVVPAEVRREGFYAAMTEAELAEVAAFHGSVAAYDRALDELHAVDGPVADARPPATRTMPRATLPAVGESATAVRTFRREDVLRFAALTGDRNPVHIEPGAWVGTPFTGNIVHGVFTSALFSQLLGMELPGPGSIYLSQTLKFTAPVYIGESVTASVTVTAVREDKRLITLHTCADVERDGAAVRVVEGEAVIKLLRAASGDGSVA